MVMLMIGGCQHLREALWMVSSLLVSVVALETAPLFLMTALIIILIINSIDSRLVQVGIPP